LVAAAGRWQEGEHTVRSGLDHDGSEFGRLGAAFDAMAEAQQQREAALERNVAERTAALRDSEARFRGIFDSAFQYTCLLAPDGMLLEVNAAALAFGGIAVADVLHRKLWDTHWWAGDATRVARLRRGVEQAARGEFVRYEAEVCGAAGASALIDFSLKPMAGKDGDVVLLIAEGRDITERSRLQAQLAQAQKMEAVGQLTGGVAHDFNNLLQAVTGNLDLIERLEEQRGNARVLRLIGNAQHAAARGARLTQQLLAFSRRQNLRPERVWVDRQATGMADLLHRAAGETIRVELLAAADPWPCLVDPAQFESALLNLVINARDAMPSGGTLTVSTVNVSLDAARAVELDAAPGDYVQVDVADAGTGIPPELMARIFEPFFTTKDIGKGSGLGLAMVHGFVRQSGGAVAIRSVVNGGTTVSMLLPRDQRPPEAGVIAPPKGHASPSEPGGALNVLLVEDDADVLDAVRLGLLDAGHRVTVAPNGQVALDLLADGGALDLLVSDLVLPGRLSGADVAEAARQRYPRLRVLFTSGYAADDWPGAEGARDAEVLRKPFSNARLLQRVAEIAAELAEAGQPVA
jgi:PAS domain S-box-containing protein